jgi:GT2 family glycosyltransferase
LCIQEFPKSDYEIIIVSDGPDPETKHQIELVGAGSVGLAQITFIELPGRRGPSAARNLGWKSAVGTIIAFTDDDCIPPVHWLKNIWDNYHWEKNIAYSGKVIVPIPMRPTDYQRNVSRLEAADFVTANCFCTRRALEQVGGFDERFTMAWREDSDLEFKFLAHKIPIKHTEKASVIHPARKSSWGVSLKEQKKNIYNALLFKKFPGYYLTRIQSSPPWHYYIMVLSFALFVYAAIFLSARVYAMILLACWLIQVGTFIRKRLSGNSKRLTHISEMIVTSLGIPFVAIFWRIYGSIKYRALFL